MSSRYTILLALFASGLITIPYAAHANFTVLKNSSQPAPQAGVNTPLPITMSPIVDPGDLRQAKSLTEKASHTFLVRWKVASGFGSKVPLGFACKQIVPPAVKVTYGPGASPDVLVTWQGGKGWNQVLLAAVKPMGMKLVMTHMAVEIRK